MHAEAQARALAAGTVEVVQVDPFACELRTRRVPVCRCDEGVVALDRAAVIQLLDFDLFDTDNYCFDPRGRAACTRVLKTTTVAMLVDDDAGSDDDDDLEVAIVAHVLATDAMPPTPPKIEGTKVPVARVLDVPLAGKAVLFKRVTSLAGSTVVPLTAACVRPFVQWAC